MKIKMTWNRPVFGKGRVSSAVILREHCLTMDDGFPFSQRIIFRSSQVLLGEHGRAVLYTRGDIRDAHQPDDFIRSLRPDAIRAAKSLGVRFMLAPVAQQLYIEASSIG